ncbi:hypothetical protein NVP1121O_152 [Vibrio phage 1.121.O._10N.286.46.C4]|nr:hypothetical protein NVP1121O_152 [Vibrio phage 1.121.O._10N.286.46.C4]
MKNRTAKLLLLDATLKVSCNGELSYQNKVRIFANTTTITKGTYVSENVLECDPCGGQVMPIGLLKTLSMDVEKNRGYIQYLLYTKAEQEGYI